MRPAILLLVLLASCGGRDRPPYDGADAGPTLDAGTDGGGIDAGGFDAGATDAGAADAGADAGTSTDAGSDAGGESALAVSLVEAVVGANCMPIVPADPFNVRFTVDYDNSAGTAPASASVLSAKVTFSGGDTLDLTVDPASVGPVAAGDSVRVTHDKTSSTPTLSDACGRCSETATAEIQLDLGDRTETLTSGSMAVGCVY